jgi:hypothetical protein
VQELSDVHANLGLESDDALLRENVRDDFPLASVIGPVPNVEETTLDGDESIVEVGLEGATSVTVDRVESDRVINRDVVRGNADDWA